MASNQAFRALADPTRRKILQILRRGEKTAGQLAEYFDMTKPSMSHHFAVLMHWGLNGQPDGYGSKLAFALTLPATMAGLTLLFAVLPSLSPKHFKIDSFMSTYLRVAAAVIGMLAYVQVLLLLAGLGRPVNMNCAIPGAICALIVLIGNVLGKMRRNFFIGIRTPWTLADERVWN